MDMPLPTGSVTRGSVCPHDCPSTCALDVEVIDGTRIGAVRGADNPYTAGVVCAKVARYADRIHHPDRLLYPMRRTGPKGSGAFTRIGWDEALDEIAAAFTGATARYGAEAVWPFNSAGTMGLVNRDGLQRLTHVMGYSRRKSTICTAIALAGWGAGVGRIAGPDPREMAASDLIVIWGGNPVSTQVNAMSHITRARKQRGAKLVVIDPYRTGTAAAADLHLAPRPGTDGALACAVMHVAFRDGYADRDYMARYADDPAALEAHVATAARTGPLPSPASRPSRSKPSPPCMAARAGRSSAAASASPAAATAPPTCTPSPACRPSPGLGRMRAAARSG